MLPKGQLRQSHGLYTTTAGNNNKRSYEAGPGSPVPEY